MGLDLLRVFTLGGAKHVEMFDAVSWSNLADQSLAGCGESHRAAA